MKKLKQILSKVLEIDETQITDETSPDNVENWDSFNGLMLVSELENGFKVKFTMDEVLAVKNVKDIKYYLKKHGVVLENE
jgi:acyl carrier protein